MASTSKSAVILLILQLIIRTWDLLTWPIYQMLYKPWEKRKKMDTVLAKSIRSNAEEVVFESTEKENWMHTDLIKAKCDTMAKSWDWAVKRFGSKELLGTRDILAHEDEVQSNGKLFKKWHLGDYRWVSYEGADSTANYFGRGLRLLGMEPKDKICIFADTRCEWFMTAIACFKHGFPLVTLYTNLGEEAVVHGVNQTEVKMIMTSHDLLPKFRNILKHTKTVTKIVFYEDQVQGTDTTGFPENVELIPFWDVVGMGKKVKDDQSLNPVEPIPKDTAIVMYTSGSTGVPKGVVLSHRNLNATLSSLMRTVDITNLVTGNDTFIAFLPLAHVLELLCENMMAMFGVRIGYSTPNTLLDKSSMVKKGCEGDVTMLKPTVMAAVPLILDRIYKSIVETLRKRGPGFEKIFNFCYEYKKAAMENGEETPVMDFIIFRKIKASFGGKLRLMFSGGAPLSKETHEYIRTCMGCPVLQGYGLTETTACATLTDWNDMNTENVGPPNQAMQIKLINWEEGNYRVTDQPRPRGEIVIGGGAVAEGYYKMPEKTAEEFYTSHGKNWFKTGDIGQVSRDGTVQIIDRKKDLVKLQFGEYVSLGKVESVLKTCPIVENVCIYGESSKSFIVALVCPDRVALAAMAKKLGKAEDLTFEQLCLDRDLTGAVLRDLINYSKLHRLEKFEIPGAVTLCKELWDPDSGYVTAAFKLKRKPLQDFYQKDLDRMYGVQGGRGV